MSPNKDYYPVAGCQAIFDRLPIETLQSEKLHQFSLFILAFLVIQERPLGPNFPDLPLPNVPLAATFKEIASIHGKPYQEWSGDPNKDIANYSADDPKDTNPFPSRFGGYCNHGAVVFPTWHRPYVMLLEQSIGNVAVQLAQTIETKYPGESGVWTKAAKELRFPYWDWAAENLTELPGVLVNNQVDIVAPGKTEKVAIDNPLSFFPYAQIPPDFTDDLPTGQPFYGMKFPGTAYYTKWKRSYRHAASIPDPPDSQTPLLQAQFKKNAFSLRSLVGQLFAYNHDKDPAIAWDEFSNHTAESKRDMDFVNWVSLEGVHDIFHAATGGNGHMADPDYAGFDPLFFIHHANVDRLCIGLMGVVPPRVLDGRGVYTHGTNKYPWIQEYGTYAQVYNAQLLPDGKDGYLYPFRTEDGDYWTSTQARSLDPKAHPGFCPKYYSYPKLCGVQVDKAATSNERSWGRAKIARYYGYDPHLWWNRVSLPGSGWENLPVPKTEHADVPDTHVVIPNFRTFSVHLKLAEHAYNSTYSFELYHKGNTYSSEQLIGITSVFARPDHSPCKECTKRRQKGSVIRGMIPIPTDVIDSIIKSHSTGQSLPTFEDTLAHVKGEFSGRLVDASGTELAKAEGGADAPKVPQDSATSNKVTPAEIYLVSSAVAEHGEDKDKQPTYLFDFQHHDSVFTAGWLATHDDSK